MYSYFYQDHGSAKKLLLKGDNGSSLTILPMYGGNIQKTILPLNDKLIQVTDSYEDEDDLLQLKQSKGIKMLPFPNRIKQGKYSFEGQDYKLTINKPNEQNAIHGLLTKALFDVAFIDCNEHRALTTLKYEYNQESNGYPFNFLVELTYILSGDGIQIETIIKNTGNQNMPIGDGWHPYFCINKQDLNKMYLQIPSKKYLEVNENMIPTGEMIKDKTFKKLSLIGDTTLDHCFILETIEENAETILVDLESQTKLVVWQSTGEGKYNYLQLYTPNERNSIAMEPMTCAPDAFNNKMGLTILKPSETLALSFGFYLCNL
jgi:aldose 1-epimerase